MITMPDGWKREDLAAWNSVWRRLPGIEREIERCVCRMAVGYSQGSQVRIDYQHEGDGFVARLEIYTRLDGHEIHPMVYPVIPDYAKPDNTPITQDMPPYVFNDLAECRKVAEEAKRIILKELGYTGF